MEERLSSQLYTPGRKTYPGPGARPNLGPSLTVIYHQGDASSGIAAVI